MKKEFFLLVFIIVLFSLGNEVSYAAEEVNNTIKENPFNLEAVQTTLVNGELVTTFEDMPDTFVLYSEGVNENTNKDIGVMCGSCVRTEYTKLHTESVTTNYNFGWHPQHPHSVYIREKGGAFGFSYDTVSFSVDVGYGMISLGISQEGSGYFLDAAKKNAWNRPAVYGTHTVTRYKVEKYNGAGKLISTTYESLSSAQDVSPKILVTSGKFQ